MIAPHARLFRELVENGLVTAAIGAWCDLAGQVLPHALTLTEGGHDTECDLRSRKALHTYKAVLRRMYSYLIEADRNPDILGRDDLEAEEIREMIKDIQVGTKRILFDELKLAHSQGVELMRIYREIFSEVFDLPEEKLIEFYRESCPLIAL